MPAARDAEVTPIPRRFGERVVGSFFRATTRVTGLRPTLVPAHMRRQLQVIGVDDAQLAHVLRNIRSLADWPYAWEAEGDRHAAAGDWEQAVACYYIGQRILLTDSPLKRRLYRLVLDAYARVDQPPIEHLRIPTPNGETVAGYLQLPHRPRATPIPTVLMVPGVTATKEELHPFTRPLLQRGYAVARIDNPGYGETTGRLEEGTEHNPAVALASLARDERLDPANLHLFGMSLGAFWCLHSAAVANPRSVVTIAPPFEPERFFHRLPAMNLTALQHMTGLPNYEQLVGYCATLTLRRVAPDITSPVRIFHGGRDRTVPVGESYSLADALGGPVALTEWPRDHHNCLEHFDEMIAASLEWFEDPAPAIREWQLEQARREREQRLEGSPIPRTDPVPDPKPQPQVP